MGTRREYVRCYVMLNGGQREIQLSYSIGLLSRTTCLSNHRTSTRTKKHHFAKCGRDFFFLYCMNCERVEGTPDPSLAIDGGINLKTLKKKKKKKKKYDTYSSALKYMYRARL